MTARLVPPPSPKRRIKRRRRSRNATNRVALHGVRMLLFLQGLVFAPLYIWTSRSIDAFVLTLVAPTIATKATTTHKLCGIRRLCFLAAATVNKNDHDNDDDHNNSKRRSRRNSMDLASLKEELAKYLEKRQEVNADQRAQDELGTVMGGTRGNTLLDYVGLAPNKESTLDTLPGLFDYSELERYGYAYLITPMMNHGGRNAMYALMNIKIPDTPKFQKTRPQLENNMNLDDENTQSTSSSFSGLKLLNILDDNLQAEAVAAAAQRRSVDEEKDRNNQYVSSSSASVVARKKAEVSIATQRLDAMAATRSKVLADAQRAQLDQVIADRDEFMELNLSQRLYTAGTCFISALAFGHATKPFFEQLFSSSSSSVSVSGDNAAAADVGATTLSWLLSVVDAMKVPATLLLLASFGASIYCILQAREKRRNELVWMIKGLMGGPVSVQLLKDLPGLSTRRERDEEEAAAAAAAATAVSAFKARDPYS